MNVFSFAKRAIALALLATSAFGAHAVDKPLGVLTPGNPPTSFNVTHPDGADALFDDNFTFQLLTPGITSGSLLEINLSGFAGVVFSSAALYSGTPMGAHSFLTSASGNSKSMTFQATLTPAGMYYLNVMGSAPANVSYGTAYNGSIYVGLAPVPEPESYAMFLAGLGVMGAIAVRRNKAKKNA